MADSKISALTAATSVNPTDLHVIVQGGVTKKITNENLVGCKVYRALLSQAGGAAPTAVVLENTLGEVPTYAYSTTGDYNLTTVAALFNTAKTMVKLQAFRSESGFSPEHGTQLYRIISTTEIQIVSFSDLGHTSADDILLNTWIEILVFP